MQKICTPIHSNGVGKQSNSKIKSFPVNGSGSQRVSHHIPFHRLSLRTAERSFHFFTLAQTHKYIPNVDGYTHIHNIIMYVYLYGIWERATLLPQRWGLLHVFSFYPFFIWLNAMRPNGNWGKVTGIKLIFFLGSGSITIITIIHNSEGVVPRDRERFAKGLE